MCQVLATRARDQGVPAAAVLPGPEPGQDLRAPAPSWPPTPGSLPSHAAPAHRSAASTSPTAATRGSSAPCSPPPSPPCAPTPSPGPTTSANETKANRLGPGRPRPGLPPHPDPARHDPRWSPLRPTTSHETTRRRLTHHIGAPPSRGRILPTERWASRACGTGGGERNRWLSTTDIFWAASEWRAYWGHWATSGTGAE